MATPPKQQTKPIQPTSKTSLPIMYLVSVDNKDNNSNTRYPLTYRDFTMEVTSLLPSSDDTKNTPSYVWIYDVKDNQWKYTRNQAKEVFVKEPSAQTIKSLIRNTYTPEFYENHFFFIPDPCITSDTITKYRIETIIPFRLKGVVSSSAASKIMTSAKLEYIQGSTDNDGSDPSVLNLLLDYDSRKCN
jgi:hypothetical protein